METNVISAAISNSFDFPLGAASKRDLLALARWIEEDGSEGLLDVLVQHAQAITESSSKQEVPQVDQILLRTLCNLVKVGATPTAGEVLATASRSGISLNSTAKGVSNLLRDYDIVTMKSNGRKVYRTSLGALAVIQKDRRIDLGIETPDPVN